MSGRAWSSSDDAVMRAEYADTRTKDLAARLDRTERAVFMRANALGLRKSAAYLTSSLACRFDGRQGPRFQKGHATWNKGIAFDSGGRSHETQFKKGQRNGMAASHYRPIGAECLNKDGNLIRKVTDTGNRRKDWCAVHSLLWEAHHGPIPRGHIVVLKDRNRENIVIENLECVTRAENMRRNSHYNRYPIEVSRLIQLRGALNRKINQLEKSQ